jgi:cytoskeleton protein RodZ
LFAELVNPLDEQMTTLLYNDDMTNSELSKPDSGSDPVQVDTLVATAPELSDDTVIDPEKTELESVADAAQVDVLAVTKEAASFADTDMPGEGVPEGGVKPIVSILKTKPKPTPSLELKVRKSSVPSIEKLNAKKLDATSAKLAEVEKIISVGEKRSKTVVEIQPLPKAEPKLEEVSSDLFAVEALETETEMALPELLTEPEATATPAPIETAARGSSRIKINAINNSWIQIRDDNLNTMLVTRLLAAGDSYAVPDQPGLVLLTGNAGALEIVVDGTIVPSIGGPGVVRRGVVLDVTRLKAGAAVSN